MSETVLVDDLAATPSLSEATRVWARVGVLSFGGPAGQIALMHRILVDEKRWIDEERFLHALSYCMLLPGPEAQQLATYIGWLLHGIRGGLIAGLLFIVPGFAVILALSAFYALFHDTTLLATVFFGIKAGVLAIVLQALIRLSGRALRTRFHIAVAIASFTLLFVFDLPFPLVVLLAGLSGYGRVLYRAYHDDHWRPRLPRLAITNIGIGALRSGRLRTAAVTLLCWLAIWQAPLLLIHVINGPKDIVAETLSGGTNVFGAIFSFFSRMAVVTFGGAYAVLAYVAQTAVQHYAWLRPGEMLDGLALAETTPGPLVLVLCFVGFMAGFRNPFGFDPLTAGFLGASLAAWATFAPSFLFIFAGAPFIERLRGHAGLSAALAAITAAIVGVMANLSVWFGLHVLFADTGRLVLLSHRVKIQGGDYANVPIAGIAWPVWTTLDVSALLLFILATVLVFRHRAGVATVLGISALAGCLLRFAG
ncbi:MULTISPECIES: chromate efflux transporter [unclassified Rhizobium]|uniref:chromate efflux transporter n=1 Tax=unclassified Rhizobium TaxID=2613769 RepID=UPI000CDF5481|nr:MULTISPECIES: chromate efflux transporter [Rhizobium]AVA20470.1 chromate transporter protein [Rhizobium sp. NXC24]UWU21755.1 chromate efflux transporter [Rhizobium tropici]